MTGTLRMKPLLVSLFASAAFCFGGAAQAQTAQAPTVRQYQTPQAERPPPRRTRPLREGVTGLGQTDVVRPPRFIVEAVNFKAVDESGRDLPRTSDEVFAVFNNAQSHHLMTETFPDVDSGEDRPFDAEQSCIWPARDPDGQRNGVWECDPAGGAGPVRFTINLFDEDVRLGALSGSGMGFCIAARSDDLGTCHQSHHTELFRHEFSYEVSQILERLDPACRCFTETARQSADSLTTYEFTFRITRVDDSREGPALDATPDEGGAIPTPVVHRSGSLTVILNQDMEFDAGAVVQSGGDFDFSRTNGAYFVTPQAGARIWGGAANPRGFAACYAERGSASYVTTTAPLPAVGSHACYITSEGRIGEFRVDSVMTTPIAGSARLVVTYTTWQ